MLLRGENGVKRVRMFEILALIYLSRNIRAIKYVRREIPLNILLRPAVLQTFIAKKFLWKYDIVKFDVNEDEQEHTELERIAQK